ncbi:MAG: hypothetical protein HC786_20410 [Richelia sp. CSU_2_1]|nr:hypothetical protein [Richelia sp. CSU_2_1]
MFQLKDTQALQNLSTGLDGGMVPVISESGLPQQVKNSRQPIVISQRQAAIGAGLAATALVVTGGVCNAIGVASGVASAQEQISEAQRAAAIAKGESAQYEKLIVEQQAAYRAIKGQK